MNACMHAAICVLALVERCIPRAFRLRPFCQRQTMNLYCRWPVFFFPNSLMRHFDIAAFGMTVAMGVERASEHTGDVGFKKQSCRLPSSHFLATK